MKLPPLKNATILQLTQSVRQLARGRSSAAGTITLTTSTATTVVSSDVISADCFPQLTPASANGATELGNGTCYVSAVADGSFTITHANNATTSRVFHWYAVGG